MKRIDLESGLVRTLASAPQPRGGTWGSTGKIMFASGSAGSLNTVPAGGGEVQAVTRLDRPRQTGHRFPHFLPDGRHFLFYSIGTAEGRGVYLGDLGSTATERLFDADSAAVFSAPDFVLFARQGVLWAQRMEMTELRPVGDPAAVSAKVAVSGELFGDIALSETAPGLIAYRAAAGMRQFIWFDRTGRQVGAMGPPDDGQPSAPQLSRDGRTMTFRRTLNGNTDLWSIEASRQVLRRLTFDTARDYEAIVSPAGDRIVFTSDRNGLLDLYEMALFGNAAPAATPLLESSEHKNISDWSDDGKFLLYLVQSRTTANDVWVLPLSGDRTPIPVAQTPASEGRARFSPDGRWVAYESNESGRSEIYVQTFPDPVRRMQVSTAGGGTPIWRRDGAELYFKSPDDHLMAARIASKGADIDIGTPSVLFQLPPGPGREATTSWYAAAADGQRFLVNTLCRGRAHHGAAELEAPKLRRT